MMTEESSSTVAVSSTAVGSESMSLVSVDELLERSGSQTPCGTEIDAVLTREPTAVAATVAVAVRVMVPPRARSTRPRMSPVPEAAGQVEPAVATQVQVTLVSSGGKLSVRVAPTTGRKAPSLWWTVMV